MTRFLSILNKIFFMLVGFYNEYVSGLYYDETIVKTESI